jgi:large subunit ribosomal protein L21
MFAVILVSGKQYKVQKGDIVNIPGVEGKEGQIVNFDQVLVLAGDKEVKVGTPTVAGVTVKAKILGFGKGEKINVRRYKSKVRHRRSIGFRPQFTNLEISSIG